MVASRHVEIPYYRAVGRQRGRGFGAPAQDIGRTAMLFLRKYVISAAKRIGADMLEFAPPEIGEVIIGRKSFKSAAKSLGKQTLRKQWVAVVNGRESLQQNLLNNPVGREETFLQTFLVDNNFRYQPFVAVSGNLGGKVPNVEDVLSSHAQQIYPTTSLDGNCTEFELQTDRNYYVDLRQLFLALKVKFVKRHGSETYEKKGKK